MRHRASALLGTCLLLAASLAPSRSSSADAPQFHVVRRIPLAGEGFWDYVTVDRAARRLYVTHGTHVQVVNLETDSLVGDILDTPGVHGVALAPDLCKGFTSNGRDSTVTVFDLKTFAILDRIHLAARFPDAIAYDSVSGRVFTMNGGSSSTSAINARTGKVAGTLGLSGRPEFAVADGKGTMFVNLEDKSELVAVDTRKLSLLNRWPLAPGEEPTGLALDRVHRRLFSGCSNKKLIVLDADSGRHVAELAIGDGVDGVAFDPERQLVFSSNGEGSLTVIHEDDAEHFSVVETATTERGGRTIALDATTGTVYVPTADFGPPPPPTADRPHPRASILPGSFRVMVIKR